MKSIYFKKRTIYMLGRKKIVYLFKHFIHVMLGFAIVFFIHKTPYHYFKALSIFGIPLVILLLVSLVSINIGRVSIYSLKL